MKTKFSSETHTQLLTYPVRQNRYAKTFRFHLAVLGLLVASQLAVKADILLGYNPTTYDYLQVYSITAASSFTVGAQDLEVTSVQFLLSCEDLFPYDTTAYIFSDTGGLPGAIVGSCSQTITPQGQNAAFINYPFANPLPLSAGGTYWVGIGDATDGLLYVSNLGDLNGFSDNGATPSLALSITGNFPPDTPHWGPVNPLTVLYQLNGYAVPEPLTAALSATGAAVLLFSRRIKHHITIL